MVCVVQHPCAFRNGSKLAKRLLVSDASVTTEVPTDWSAGHFKAMFLPDVDGDGDRALKVNFQNIRILTPEEISLGSRAVVLSAYGVNLLLQRWIHHNSRVIVPTARLDEITAGPYDEADLVGDSVPGLLALGYSMNDALAWLEAWLSGDQGGTGRSRRVALISRQTAAAVRSELRRAIGGLSNIAAAGAVT
jgi:hypothetical protein